MNFDTPRREPRPLAAAGVLLLASFTLLLFLLLQPSATSAQGPVQPPQATPDAERGLLIYAERCASCHGPLGLGDGEMAPQLPQPPAALGREAFVQQAVPAHMFQTITDGILPAGMPPFGPQSSNPLSESERWDVVAAIYSLGASRSDVEMGQAIYEASCQECHGAEGDQTASDLGDAAYWLERSHEGVLGALTAGDIPEHDTLDVAQEELAAVVTYARTLSYEYADPMAAFAPIEAAVITGTVTNQTTGDSLPEGTPVELSAFTPEFEPSLTMTTTLDEEGRFAFDLTMVPPDLVYVATIEYDGINYGSDFGRIDRGEGALALSVPVYEHSTDPSSVYVSQLHIILEFVEGQVQVSELYQFSQEAPVVFVGETGQAEEGTVHISLPNEASNPSFNRSFGGMESFFPAENVIRTENGWADTVPLRPGQGTLSLLVRYTMPYDRGLTFAHDVHYTVDSVNLVLPDAGVELTQVEQWQTQGPQTMGEAGVFLNYARQGLPAGDSVRFGLEGRPRQIATSAGNVPLRDENTELLVGGGVLLLAVVLGGYALHLWRNNQAAPAGDVAVAPAPGSAPVAGRRDELLQAIAALDDAHEAGEIDDAAYEEQRQALKEELLEIWEEQ
ncbi:MAG TPA: c-type cytochrome [Candidatus Sulfomarinibacteraceae bacterium]|nr:c-type cytochrome [Candidatus Sulfomarinibacteraceae bacterium]